jgi:hypothetical protein
MKSVVSGPSARAALCAAVISAAFLLGAAGAQAKGGSPGWHGLPYQGAMLGGRGAYACEVPVRAHLTRLAVHICRTGH